MYRYFATYKVILHRSFSWGAYNLSKKVNYEPKKINFYVEIGKCHKYIKIWLRENIHLLWKS